MKTRRIVALLDDDEVFCREAVEALGAEFDLHTYTRASELFAALSQCATVVTAARDAKRYHEERERLIRELQEALLKVKQLSGLLPICMHCKKIRDDAGDWQQIETYITQHAEVDFSHGICPVCLKEHYPEHWERMLKDGGGGA